MRKEYLIVDGYNIINAWPELKEISEHSINLARDRLVEIMAEYQAYKGIRVIIVFDGHLVKGNCGSELTLYGVQVVFTKEHESADSYIERKVKMMAPKALVKVATSDWAEQQTILAMGGIRLSANELRGLVAGVQRDIKRRFLERDADRINTVDGNLSPEIIQKLQKWGKIP